MNNNNIINAINKPIAPFLLLRCTFAFVVLSFPFSLPLSFCFFIFAQLGSNFSISFVNITNLTVKDEENDHTLNRYGLKSFIKHFSMKCRFVHTHSLTHSRSHRQHATFSHQLGCLSIYIYIFSRSKKELPKIVCTFVLSTLFLCYAQLSHHNDIKQFIRSSVITYIFLTAVSVTSYAMHQFLTGFIFVGFSIVTQMGKTEWVDFYFIVLSREVVIIPH